VELVNPLSSDAAQLRRSLLPGLLHGLAENRRYGASYVAGYTLGRVFAREQDRYHEAHMLGLVLAGAWPPSAVGAKDRACDFFAHFRDFPPCRGTSRSS